MSVFHAGHLHRISKVCDLLKPTDTIHIYTPNTDWKSSAKYSLIHAVMHVIHLIVHSSDRFALVLFIDMSIEFATKVLCRLSFVTANRAQWSPNEAEERCKENKRGG